MREQRKREQRKLVDVLRARLFPGCCPDCGRQATQQSMRLFFCPSPNTICNVVDFDEAGNVTQWFDRNDKTFMSTRRARHGRARHQSTRE